MIQKNILITKKQNNFIKDQRKSFEFSKFVRGILDKYIKFKESLDGNEKVE